MLIVQYVRTIQCCTYPIAASALQQKKVNCRPAFTCDVVEEAVQVPPSQKLPTTYKNTCSSYPNRVCSKLIK